MTGLKWTRKTTRNISQELHKVDIAVSHTTVARLLDELDYRLRVNHKKLAGNFKNAGALWCLTPELVNDHDFRTDAVGIAILYGVYDLVANCGALSVGTSHDTAYFAVDSLTAWWQGEAGTRYAHTNQLLVLADNGGSNGSRVRAWRYALQPRIPSMATSPSATAPPVPARHGYPRPDRYSHASSDPYRDTGSDRHADLDTKPHCHPGPDGDLYPSPN